MPSAPTVEFIRDRSGAAPIVVQRASIYRTHGITPNVMQLDIIPIDANDLAFGGRTGTLRAEYEGAVLRMRDCLIDASSIVVSTSNLVRSLTILDHRWKWRFGSVRGHFNRRTATGKLITQTRQLNERFFGSWERDIREMARSLLLYMDELDIDNPQEPVEALPEGTGPEMEWEDDNPARMLAALCEMFGCRVVMDWSNKTKVWRLGQSRFDTPANKQWEDKNERAAERRAQRLARLSGGSGQPPLPAVMPVISYAETVDADERPDEIRVYTAPIVYQWDMELEAVGEDTNGAIKPLKDLSYAPNPNAADGGFGGEDGLFNMAIGVDPDPEDGLDEDTRKLAIKSVFRWYRIKTPFTFPTTEVNEEGQRVWAEVRALPFILPIYAAQSDTAEEDGLLVAKAPVVYGKYFNGTENSVSTVVPLPMDGKGRSGNVQQSEKMVVDQDYYIDTRKGVVKFRQGIAAVTGDDWWTPATLRLRASFSIRDSYYGQWNNRSIRREQPEPKLGTQHLPIRRYDLVPVRQPRFDLGRASFANVDIATNDQELDALANEHIDAIEEVFAGKRPTQITYAGFYPQFELDGVIRMISFSIDTTDPVAPIRTRLDLDQDTGGEDRLSYVAIRQHERILTLRDRVNILTKRQETPNKPPEEQR
jgi:hypothetical protein